MEKLPMNFPKLFCISLLSYRRGLLEEKPEKPEKPSCIGVPRRASKLRSSKGRVIFFKAGINDRIIKGEKQFSYRSLWHHNFWKKKTIWFRDFSSKSHLKCNNIHLFFSFFLEEKSMDFNDSKKEGVRIFKPQQQQRADGYILGLPPTQ